MPTTLSRSMVMGIALVVCLCIAPASVSLYAQDAPPIDNDPRVQERLARSMAGASTGPEPSLDEEAFFSQAVPLATSDELLAAIDIPLSIVTEATLIGPESATGVFTNLGVIEPTAGATLALLSSGVAGASDPEPGNDFSPIGTSGDRVQLEVRIAVPEEASLLSFDFNFLSTEHPDFIGTIFNDTFQAFILDSSGLREIARASVNSSVFADVSDTNAAGSGFDIYTDDPAGVDSTFGGGLPDAGITGQETVTAPVVGGETITLTFSVEDRGDGILDSAVVLDNFYIGSLEFLDPSLSSNFVTLVDSSGTILNLPEELNLFADSVIGAVTDGSTQVVVRASAPVVGDTLEICIDGTFPADGFMQPLGGGTPAQCVDATAVQTTSGIFAYAVYNVPDTFSTGPETDALTQRDVPITVTNPSGAAFSKDMRLSRPPVVLLHGLWGTSASWDLGIENDNRYRVDVWSYEPTNDFPFATNQEVPTNAARAQIVILGQSDIAASQSDIVAHSMGGILSRLTVNLPDYERQDNRFQGYINRLITVNTPHYGSELANVLVDRRDNGGGVATLLISAIETIVGGSVSNGAIDDLQVGSVAILSQGATDVRGHALYGNPAETSDEMKSLGGGIGSLYTSISFFNVLTDPQIEQIFNGPNDGIVSVPSQIGGITVSTNVPGPEGAHTVATGGAGYNTQILNLLNQPANGASFAPFPAPQAIVAPGFLPLLLAPPAEETTTDPAADEAIEPLEPAEDVPAVPLAADVEEDAAEVPAAAVEEDVEEAEAVEAAPEVPAAAVEEDVEEAEAVEAAPAEPAAEPAEAAPVVDTEGTVFRIATSRPLMSATRDRAFLPYMMPAMQSPAPVGFDLTSSATSVQSGETITLTATPIAPIVLDSVAFVGPGFFFVDAAAPFEATFTVPIDAIGNVQVTAFGQDAGGTFYSPSSDLVLDVSAPATLDSIIINPTNPVLFSIGATQPVSVVGRFADSVERIITDAVTGTAYISANPSIVSVDSDGLLTANGFGTTTLIAQNGSVQSSVSVTVFIDNIRPVADAGPDTFREVGDTIALDGTGSFDPDNSPNSLEYEWLQIAGPSTSVGGPQSAVASFRPAEPGEYIFSLVVRDGVTDSVPNTVRVLVSPSDGDDDDDGDGDGDRDIDLTTDSPFVSQVVTPPIGPPGDVYDWTIVVTNVLDAPITNLELSQVFSNSVNLVSASASQGVATISGDQMSYLLDLLPAGEAVTINVRIAVPADFDQNVLVATSCLLFSEAGGAECTSTELLLASNLPQTGESPLWSWVLRAALLSLVSVGIYVTLNRALRRHL